MNNRQFNGIYRPLVKQAWESYCRRTGISPDNKSAYNKWYRTTLRSLTQGKIESTKGISNSMQHYLIAAFQKSTPPQHTIPINGWSDAQIARFNELAVTAWRKSGSQYPLEKWIAAIFHQHHRQQKDGIWQMPEKKESFDKLMAHLAVIANDEYWIKRTAEQGEIRLKWQLRRYLADLDYLDKTFKHDWNYVRGIYKQSRLLPADIDDCPADTLWKVLAMLDTHIRRLCIDLGLAPMELPTRAHPAAHPVTISDNAKHLHVGHKLEHIAPVEYHDQVPF